MTENSNSIVAACGDVALTTREFLDALHLRRQLRPRLLEVLSQKVILTEAKKVGLSVSDDELQVAADVFRQRQGLNSAAATQSWLEKECLSMQDFEQGLEREILIDKFIDHATRDHIASFFEANRADFDRLRLREILVAREDLAQELFSQIHEEGGDFAALAREHSLHPSRADDGLLGTAFRHQLAEPVAKALAAVAVGEAAAPVATGHGFHLFMVEAVEPAELTAAVRETIRDVLFRQWLQARMQQAEVSLPILERR